MNKAPIFLNRSEQEIMQIGGEEIAMTQKAKEYTSAEKASLQLGICPRVIRKLMRLGEIDLGLAIPPYKEKSTWTFKIYQEKIDKILGKESENEPN